MITIEKTGGGMTHTSAFIGPTDHTLNLWVDVSTLTTKEVDINGCLKPNVPFNKDGALIGAKLSTVAAAVANDDNTGNGTVGALAGKAGGVTEVITLRATSATNFEVRGSRSGVLGDATVGTPYVSSALNFTITAGGTAFVAGDEFTLIITGADEYVYGVTVEASKIVAKNPTNASLLADTRRVPVAVATICQVNRYIARDTLDREYTAAEIAAFEAPGSKCVLSPANPT